MAKRKRKPRPRGRPKWMPSEADIEKIAELAERGLTLEQIAYSMGISYVTLNDRAQELTEIPEAIKRGRSKAIELVSGKLYEGALVGNTTAQIFFLKAIGKWKDRVEHSGDPERPVVLKQHGKGTPEVAGEIAGLLDEARPKK